MTDVLVGSALEKNPGQVSRMFDRIATRYDLLNHFLSLGQDFFWRQATARCLPNVLDLKILDVATGTAELAIALQRERPYACIFGIDLAQKMLELGRRKVAARKMEIDLALGDAADLEFVDKIFDVVTVAFGIRNMQRVDRVLGEMFRVLKPRGKVLILEFTKPPPSLISDLYGWYFQKVMPKIGGLVSGDLAAYTYLRDSVESFMKSEIFVEKMAACGFENIRMQPMTFGTVTLYEATRPDCDFFDD